MGVTTLTLPRLGETMEEARVTDWLVMPGAAFARGDVLLEVETDKTVVEVPALSAGVMQAHLVGPGEMVEIGQPIAEVESETSTATAARAKAAEPPAPPVSPDLQAARPSPPGATLGLRASPHARRVAQRQGIDINTIVGTGRSGRVTTDDVTNAGAAKPRIAGMACNRQGTDAGAGTVCLLHGLFSSSKSFAGLSARLARAGAQVVIPDLPGHGDSPNATGLQGIEDALAQLIDFSAPSGSLYMVGHSMGAILATRLALRFGDRVKRLVLVAPAGLGPRMNQLFLDILSHAETPAALRNGLSLLGTGLVSDTVLRQELSSLFRHRAAHHALSRELAVGGIQQIDIAADLAAVTMPIRALFGTSDAVLDWHDCTRLPSRAAIHLRAGSGHMPHLGAEALLESMILS